MDQPGAMALTAEAVDLIQRPTMGAYRTIRPADRLQMIPGLGFIGENGVGEVDRHGNVPFVEETLAQVPTYVKGIIPTIFLLGIKSRRNGE
jgi:hypothetical protein